MLLIHSSSYYSKLAALPLFRPVSFTYGLLVFYFFLFIFGFLRYPKVSITHIGYISVFSEGELTFAFAICRRPSVRLSVVCLSVTFVHPTQAIEIFGSVSTPFGTMIMLISS